MTLAALTLGLGLQIVVGSSLEHRTAQTIAFDRLRNELAQGTAPTGPFVSKHRLLPLGTPIALIKIQSLRVQEVVGEGTTGSVLMSGPGHLRSTVFPGGAGTSVIYGRAAAYGGPFGQIGHLHRGERITVTTAVGTSTFRVLDVRKAGDRVKLPVAGKARLTLGTATGTPFVPSGVVWVDADLVGTPLAASAPGVSTVPADEQPLGNDTSTVWALVLWLEALLVALAGAVWTWHRRGHAQAWMIFSAPTILVGYFVADQIVRLFPNMM